MDSTERHRPGPLPSPPADFAALRLPIRNDRGPWIRQHGCRRTAAYFGKTGANRFDAPNGEYGVLYAGADEFCAFIEVYGDPLDHRLVARRDLNEQCWSRITVARLLRLVDLTGAGARRIGLDGRISTENHAWTQRWALAIWHHSEQPDGILYRARHDLSRVSVAIFDHAAGVVNATQTGRLTNDPARLGQILDFYGFALTE